MYHRKWIIDNVQLTIKDISSKKGQSLMELVVVIAMTIVVISALVFATIASLRNARLAQNQIQATKLAQQGLEKIRGLRDRDGGVDFTKADFTHTEKFSDLWTISFSCPDNCYFFFNSPGVLTGGTDSNFETPVDSPDFLRQFQIEDEGEDMAAQKKVTALVKWTDFAGEHESRLTTILRNTK